MKILCLDFDGVCHSYTSRWQGADIIPDPPVEGLEEFLLEAVQEFRVCIFSSRSHQPGGVEAMRDWFEKHGMGQLPLEFPREKPPAFLTLDDRALLFAGRWPNINTLLNFKPWNK